MALERELTALAARASGHTTDGGLGQYADHRALPGGVRLDLDPIREVAEELADARNYCVWGIERVHARFVTGDPDAAHEYDRLMRCLAGVVAAWHALHS